MAQNSHRTGRANWLLIMSNLLIPVAVLTFATGFFPYKPFMPGLAQFEELGYGNVPQSQFDKIVFMVVDALRSDFVYGSNSGFSFTQSLIRSGEAIPFTAHATSPTITMPRVKAITTGSIPSFLDVILNFAESDTTSTLATQDTWLAQIKKEKKNQRLVMYGDDTWLKLFPGMFDRADGTSSFFVSDFTEVDNNVTRHVPHELRADDWDAMIMHYLGLDHIGHKSGPLSPHMVPKQREMDGIVQEIYEAMTSMQHLDSTLLVLCGDHGMNEGGNHGGSAPGETSPALVFISPKLKRLSSGKTSPTNPRQDYDYYAKIEQSDVAPTIASLLGIPIPLNNLGVMISDFLPLWPSRQDQFQLLLRNARQMLKIVEATFPSIDFEGNNDSSSAASDSAGDRLAGLWKAVQGSLSKNGVAESELLSTLEALYTFCREAQDIMSSTASNYDVNRLLCGIALACSSVLLVVLNLHGSMLRDADFIIFTLITILYSIMMFASSYVEEEQHFWYWIGAGWIASLAWTRKTTSLPQWTEPIAIAVLTIHRVVQRWNQTGQKFAGASDIVQDILRPQPLTLWALNAATYLFLLYRIGNHIVYDLKSSPAVGTACALALVIPSFLFKVGFAANDSPELLLWLGEENVRYLAQIPLVGTARVVFSILASQTIWAFSAAANADNPSIARKRLPQVLLSFATLFLVTQSRTTNIPLFLLFSMQHDLLSRLQLRPLQITITSLVFGQVAFFALGNSNAISSIDLSNAYNGVSGYNVLAVGVLVFLGNWAGPVWWAIGGVALLIKSAYPQSEDGNDREARRKRWIKMEMDHLAEDGTKDASKSSADAGKGVFETHATVSTLFVSASLLAVMVACTLLRTHLFIWTVFSPKYLYAMSWTLAFHLIVSIGMCGGIWWFSTRS